MELALGGLAAVGAGFFSNPLEVVKIRMQLQGELQAKGQYAVHYRNVFHAAFTIGTKDGLTALQKGLVPALWYQWVMNGTRLGMYQMSANHGLTKNKNGDVSLFGSVVCASIAGATGAVIGSPWFLVKTQLQSRANDASIAVGQQHEHSSMTPAFKDIYKKFGFWGFWRGCSSSVPRIVVASAVQLPVFDKSLQLVKRQQWFAETSWLNPFCASMVAGLFVSFFMAPFDLISTRFYNQAVDKQGNGVVYKNIWQCALKISGSEGIFGFFKGWTANYFRLGPHTLICLMFWDKLKHLQKEYNAKHS